MRVREVESAGLRALESAVGELIGRVRALEGELRSARERNSEAEAALEKFSADDRAPMELAKTARTLETENANLRDRLERGRETAERLLAKIRFLEEQG